MNASLSHLSHQIDRYEKNSLGVGKKKKRKIPHLSFFTKDCEKTSSIKIKEKGKDQSRRIAFIIN